MSVYRFLLGEDVFISYSRADAVTYAAALANRLGERGFSCFLDQWDSLPGEDIPPRVLRALQRSSLLVIAGSKAAAHSPAVRLEVATFLSTRRPVVPISVGGALESAAWFGDIRGASLSAESESQLEMGSPSEAIIRRVEQSASFTKRNTRLRRTFAAGTAGLILLTAAAGWSSYQAKQAEKEAVANANEAKKQTALAERNAAAAKEQEAVAIARTAEAQQQQLLAEERRAEALQQARTAESRKLSAEALVLLDREPELALQRAVQAIRRADNEASRDALVRALAHARWIRAILPGRFSGVSDAAFSADGSLIALADYPCATRLTVLDVASLQTKYVHTEGQQPRPQICLAAVGYSSLAFTPGDGHVAAQDFDGMDVIGPAGKVVRLKGAQAVNPRDRWHAFVSEDGRSVVYRDDARRALRSMPLNGEKVKQLLFTSDGRRLIARTERSLLIWKIEQFRRWRFEDPDPPPSLTPVRIDVGKVDGFKRVTTDDKTGRIALLSYNTVRVWELESGKQLGEIRAGAEFLLEAAALWPGRDYVITGGGGGATGAPTLAIWQISSGQYVGPVLIGIDRKVTVVSFAPNGRHLLTADNKGNAILWDVSGSPHLGRMLAIPRPAAPSALAVAPRGSVIAVGYADGTLGLHDHDADRPLGDAGTLRAPVVGLRFTGDGRRLNAAAADGTLAVLDLSNRRFIASARLPVSPKIARMAASPDGKHVFVVDASATGYVAHAGEGTGKTPPVRIEDVLEVASHPTMPYWLSLGRNHLNVRRLMDASLVGRGIFPASYNILAIRPDGTQLALIEGWHVSLFQDRALNSILEGPERLPAATMTLRGHTEPITAAAYSRDGRWLATSALRFQTRAAGTHVIEDVVEPGDKYEIRLWDSRSGAEIGSPFTTTRRLITHLEFSAEGGRLLSMSADGTVIAWDVDPRSWIRRSSTLVRN